MTTIKVTGRALPAMSAHEAAAYDAAKDARADWTWDEEEQP